MASQVVDILMQRGRDQAAAALAKGQIYSNLATGLGDIPEQRVERQQRQKTLDLQTQRLNLEVQDAQARAAATQRALQGQKDANDLIANAPRMPDGTFDGAKILQGLAGKNVPLEQQGHITATIDGLNKVITSWNTSKMDHLADLAHALRTSHKAGDPISPESVHIGAAVAKSLGQATDEDEQKITQALGQPGADPDKILRYMESQHSAKKYEEKPIIVPKGGTAITPEGQPLFKGEPAAPTEVELALKAAGGDATKAMGLLKPTAQAKGTPEQQYLEALQNGDQAKAENILDAIKKTTAAKAGATASDVGITADTRTTATGRSYVDLSKYKGKDYHEAQQQAHAQGVYGASAAESDALQNIETARSNIDLIEKSIPKLPSSPLTRGPKLPLVGAVGPGALAVRAEAALQLDPDLAAWGTWRTAAIQAMRALAGSKGLRINKSEIEASMENDIP